MSESSGQRSAGAFIVAFLLVDHARRRDAAKRCAALPPASGLVVQPDVDVLGLDEALNRLAVTDPAKARLVELRYFGGLSVREIADITGTSPATVKRQWAVTKAWLYRAMKGANEPAAAT